MRVTGAQIPLGKLFEQVACERMTRRRRHPTVAIIDGGCRHLVGYQEDAVAVQIHPPVARPWPQADHVEVHVNASILVQEQVADHVRSHHVLTVGLVQPEHPVLSCELYQVRPAPEMEGVVGVQLHALPAPPRKLVWDAEVVRWERHPDLVHNLGDRLLRTARRRVVNDCGA